MFFTKLWSLTFSVVASFFVCSAFALAIAVVTNNAKVAAKRVTYTFYALAFFAPLSIYIDFSLTEYERSSMFINKSLLTYPVTFLGSEIGVAVGTLFFLYITLNLPPALGKWDAASYYSFVRRIFFWRSIVTVLFTSLVVSQIIALWFWLKGNYYF